MSTYRFKVKLNKNTAASSGGNALEVEEVNLHPPVARYEDENFQAVLLGSPIYKGAVDRQSTIRSLLGSFKEEFIRNINGSFLFLIYDKKDRNLKVINDRFASIPFFYYFDGNTFMGSVNYAELWSSLKNEGKLVVNKEAIYEFIVLQRLMGNKTYDKMTVYLDSASILIFDAVSGTVKSGKYWRPDFAKRRRPKKEVSRLLAERVSDSFSRRTADGKKYGLLLSGGLDSRLILASAKVPLECLTVGFYENNECVVAEELAREKGYPHHFIKRPLSHYGDMLKEGAFLGGGMNVYAHAHFLNLDRELSTRADVFFHGHGLDYLFQGKYIPHKTLKVLGCKTYVNRITDPGRNVADAFLNSVSYRLKSINPANILKDEKVKEMKKSLSASLERVINEGSPFCNDGYDLWDYLTVHNLSRHYTFLNVASIRTIAEERIIAFDNDLFDLYLSLPAEDRFDRTVFAEAIAFLDKRLAEIRNANTNFSIYDNGLALTAKVGVGRILRKMGIKATLPPDSHERSWPSGIDLISNEKVRQRVENLIESSLFDTADFLDRKKVAAVIDEHLSGRRDYSDLLLRLISIDAFINK